MASSSTVRIRLIFVAIFLTGALFVYRLFFLQIVQGAYYANRADRQYQLAENQLFDRGAIFFKEKNGRLVSAAAVGDGFILAIDPSALLDPLAAYRQLSQVVTLDQADFLQKAAKSDDHYEAILSRLDRATADRLSALRLSGVTVQKDRWRSYPAGRLAAHTIGFLGYEGEVLAGRYGLERQYDAMLGRRVDKSFVGFLQDTLNELGRSVLGQAVDHEADLVLTIEPTVQATLEAELAALEERWSPDSAGGLIIDPLTGAVRALAAWPNFNPGERQDNIVFLSNPLVENVFEFGSIVKPLTMAAALDAGAVIPQTAYQDNGYVELAGRRIANYDGVGRGRATMQEVLGYSLNTGAIFAMHRLGPEAFKKYLLDYGLAEPTGIDLPNEATGLLKNLESGRPIEFATAAFGQGVAFTPIAMARALAALANGGRLIQPRLVEQVRYRNSKLTQELTGAPGRAVLKPETSRTITAMLVKVVDDYLAGGKVKLANYQIAAKTGTAQIARPEGGYYEDNYLHSFFGYFPASAPRFLVLLYLVNPQQVRYASETLTTPFMDLAKFLLNYYQVPPDRHV